MDVKEHERLSNIYTKIKVKEPIAVRNNLNVNKQEILSNMTLRHKLK